MLGLGHLRYFRLLLLSDTFRMFQSLGLRETKWSSVKKMI
jgi:hypothetical protein